MKDEGEASAIVNASGGQGVVIGARNTQNNYYPLISPSFLTTLSPHKAVGQLRAMSHDEAMLALASAPLGDAAEVLKVMLKSDEGLSIALLADMNPRKATELIEALGGHARWLEALPYVSQEIAHEASELGWDRDRCMGVLERVTESSTYRAAYFRKYGRCGRIWWGGGAIIRVGGEMDEAYEAHGGPRGVLGLPQSGEYPVSRGATAAVQDFKNGRIYVWARGVYAVWQPIFGKYEPSPGEAGCWLGFPVAPAEVSGEHTRQRFEGGTIYSSKHGVFSVPGDLAEKIDSELPVADEAKSTSPHGGAGITQSFVSESGGQLLFCSLHTKNGFELVERLVYRLRGRTLAYHQALGGAGGSLGFPVSDPERIRDRAWRQKFEDGTVYDVDGREVVTVPNATLRLIGLSDGGTRFGWPDSEESPIGGNNAERIQFFERGIVTVHFGARKIWPHP